MEKIQRSMTNIPEGAILQQDQLSFQLSFPSLLSSFLPSPVSSRPSLLCQGTPIPLYLCFCSFFLSLSWRITLFLLFALQAFLSQPLARSFCLSQLLVYSLCLWFLLLQTEDSEVPWVYHDFLQKSPKILHNSLPPREKTLGLLCSFYICSRTFQKDLNKRVTILDPFEVPRAFQNLPPKMRDPFLTA